MSNFSLAQVFSARTTLIEMLEQRGYSIPYGIKHISKDRLSIMVDLYIKDKLEILDIYILNKDDNNNTIRSYVAFIKDDKDKTLVQTIKKFNDIYSPTQYDSLIIVLMDPENIPSEKLYLKYENNNISIFSLKTLQINITKHIIVPKFTVLTETEKEDVLKSLRINCDQLPIMNRFHENDGTNIIIGDPIARFYGMKGGDIVKVQRNSVTSGLHYAYRYITGDKPSNFNKGTGVSDIKQDEVKKVIKRTTRVKIPERKKKEEVQRMDSSNSEDSEESDNEPPIAVKKSKTKMKMKSDFKYKQIDDPQLELSNLDDNTIATIKDPFISIISILHSRYELLEKRKENVLSKIEINNISNIQNEVNDYSSIIQDQDQRDEILEYTNLLLKTQKMKKTIPYSLLENTDSSNNELSDNEKTMPIPGSGWTDLSNSDSQSEQLHETEKEIRERLFGSDSDTSESEKKGNKVSREQEEEKEEEKDETYCTRPRYKMKRGKYSKGDVKPGRYSNCEITDKEDYNEPDYCHYNKKTRNCEKNR